MNSRGFAQMIRKTPSLKALLVRILGLALALCVLWLPGHSQAQFDQFAIDGPINFNVQKGSLRTNIRRLVESAGWRLVAWDQHIQRDRAVLDWEILAEYTLVADSIDDALEQLIAPYSLHARLHEPDRAVALYLFEKIQFSSEEE